jgi:hypothetical protein
MCTCLVETRLPVQVSTPVERRAGRKRLRFEAEDDGGSEASTETNFKRCKVMVMETVSRSSEWTTKEKNMRWMSEEDKIRQRDENAVEARRYRTSYAQVYWTLHEACASNCHVAPEVTALLSIHCVGSAQSTPRGLEDRIIPLKALQRRLQRRQVVRTIVQASKTKSCTSEQVGDLSRALTSSAVQLGRVLATADAAVAAMEYAASLNEPQQEPAPPADNPRSCSPPQRPRCFRGRRLLKPLNSSP